jgi:lipopolysaccharide biosynthesis glycosyltransferase
MITCNTNDLEPYLTQTKVLLCSLRENYPNHKVLVYLVNSEGANKDLENIHPNCEIINKTIKFRKDPKAEMSCFRSDFTIETLKKYKEPVLYLDVDTIVRKDLSEIFNDLKGNSFKVLKRDWDKVKNCKPSDYYRINSGVFAIGYSQNSISMLEDCSQRIKRDVHFPVDQKMLYLSWVSHKKTVNLIELNRSFNDCDPLWNKEKTFSPSSHIWHCKASRFLDPTFQKEWKHYLSKV